MNRNEKKRYLQGYQSAIMNLQKLQDEYETVFTEATKIVPELSGMPSSNVKDDRTLKFSIKLAEIRTKIDKTKIKIAKIDKELANLRPYHKQLIEMTDINRFPVALVAQKMRLTEHAVRTKRNRIIDKMDL